jgi:glycyl-tRNA synthetase
MNEGSQLGELAKRRGFFFPANEAYGGSGGFYAYGPQGAGVKDNIESSWRELFVVQEGNMEIQTPTIMPEAVFEASGHLDGFDDLLVECPSCHETHRADHLIEAESPLEDVESRPPSEVSSLLSEYDIHCPACGEKLADEPVEEFNLMFGTNIGPGTGTPGYLRPETAQGIFVEFPRLIEYARGQLPAGVTQVGTAYRNEISPRRGLIRLREFTQAELELFIDPETDSPSLASVASEELRLYSASNQQSSAGSVETYSVREAVEEGMIVREWIAEEVGGAKRRVE